VLIFAYIFMTFDTYLLDIDDKKITFETCFTCTMCEISDC